MCKHACVRMYVCVCVYDHGLTSFRMHEPRSKWTGRLSGRGSNEERDSAGHRSDSSRTRQSQSLNYPPTMHLFLPRSLGPD